MSAFLSGEADKTKALLIIFGGFAVNKSLKFILPVIALSVLFGAGELYAKGAVINGDIETQSLTPFWTVIGGSSANEIVLFSTKPGLPTYCLKRKIGPPANNGAIEQKVFLKAGATYIFSADIAAQYCAS